MFHIIQELTVPSLHFWVTSCELSGTAGEIEDQSPDENWPQLTPTARDKDPERGVRDSRERMHKIMGPTGENQR